MGLWNSLQEDSTKVALKGATAGLLFAAGWWVWIDAYTYTRVVLQPADLHGTKLDIGWLAGIISTLGLFLVNLVPDELLSGSGWGDGNEDRARIFFVFSVITTFGGLTAAVIIMTRNYVNDNVDYLSAAIIVQNVLIVLSSLLLRIKVGDGGYSAI
eukprot:comp23387_c0_seq1/m.38741 comp23387_c0_seq1/g.38741  ORF comp23387_c0_seq1/g.38741 comp23387_c0_seq1/m.38741 type:complete len:156 (-) comp23387_c0_seq1:482-949(-)